MSRQVLLVHDGRDVRSWGDRSSSLALGQQIRRFTDFESIGRRTVQTPVAVGPFVGGVRDSKYGERVIRHLLDPKGGLAQQLLLRSLAIAGVHADFVTTNPMESVDRFLRAARSDSELQQIFGLFEHAHGIIVNGLGSMVFRYPRRRDLDYLLFALALAVRMKKPAYLVNALASDCPWSGTIPEVEAAVYSTLEQATGVMVRDPMSQQRLEALGLHGVSMVPDAAFTWGTVYREIIEKDNAGCLNECFEPWPESHAAFRQDRWPREYVLVTGASVHPGLDVSHWPNFFESIISRVKDETGLQVVVAGSGEDFLASVAERTQSIYIREDIPIALALNILANARAMLSGRFHPSVLASLGGVPCTFLECSAHKTFSLQLQLLYQDPRVFTIEDSSENLELISDDLVRKVHAPMEVRASIRSASLTLGVQAEAGLSSMLSSLTS